LPKIRVNISYPNGGSWSQIYVNDGLNITITPPPNVYGDFAITVSPVCNEETGFIGEPTAPVILTVVNLNDIIGKPILEPTTKNVFLINMTGSLISLQYDMGTQAFGIGINGFVGLLQGGYLKNVSGATYKFTFIQSMPSMSDVDESPNPHTLIDSASHTLNANLSLLNYIKVELP
jgi:hypothetical protein